MAKVVGVVDLSSHAISAWQKRENSRLASLVAAKKAAEKITALVVCAPIPQTIKPSLNLIINSEVNYSAKEQLQLIAYCPIIITLTKC